MNSTFLVLDFGSQYTQLIARRLREFHVYSEILPFDASLAEIKAKKPKGIIISGGPSSVSDSESPKRDTKELAQIAPLLGICYGMQLIAQNFGGRVLPSGGREYGLNFINWTNAIGDVAQNQKVWMSHGDVVEVPPLGFEVIATSEDNHIAAMQGPNILALQFHPEVSHTEQGMDVLRHFVFNFCEAEADWQPKSIAEHLIEEIREKVPVDEKVLCALSGGVDSTVVATLLTKALDPEHVHCVFVDTGLLRKNEFEEVLAQYDKLGLNVHGVNAKKYFFKKLANVVDPEEKRKIIGHAFIDTFKHTISKLEPMQWLAQGTLYPDVIESVSLRGTNVTIKSHHNVGGLPENLDLKLIEPLRELFKDEVRSIGRQLGIPEPALQRHPFPGPGLAIRIIGDVNDENVALLQECDDIYIRSLREEGLYDKIWQAFCVLLPIQTVGVQGDSRTYEKVLALRAVTSSDGMTADWFSFNESFMRKLSNRITNEVSGINRVVYDVTSKPPGTIEWE
ncbi:MAG: glutamine-hydrolyzing GMP synthase [Bdellovibrionales bacterium]|nr:glutamine-hydrolyzing GMP synthase [Bdellovibrionales bacterium]